MKGRICVVFPLVAVFVVGCAVGWVAKDTGTRPAGAKESPPRVPPVASVVVNKPDGKGSYEVSRFCVVRVGNEHVPHPGAPDEWAIHLVYPRQPDELYRYEAFVCRPMD